MRNDIFLRFSETSDTTSTINQTEPNANTSAVNQQNNKEEGGKDDAGEASLANTSSGTTSAQPEAGDPSAGSHTEEPSVADGRKSQASAGDESLAHPSGEKIISDVRPILNIPRVRPPPASIVPPMRNPHGVRLRLPKAHNSPVFSPRGMCGPRIRLPVTQQQNVFLSTGIAVQPTTLPPSASSQNQLDATEEQRAKSKNESDLCTSPQAEIISPASETLAVSTSVAADVRGKEDATEKPISRESDPKSAPCEAVEKTSPTKELKSNDSAAKSVVPEKVMKTGGKKGIIRSEAIESVVKRLSVGSDSESDAEARGKVTGVADGNADKVTLSKESPPTEAVQTVTSSERNQPVPSSPATPIYSPLPRVRSISASEASPGLQSPTTPDRSPQPARTRKISSCEPIGSPGAKVTRITSVLSTRVLPTLPGRTVPSRTRSESENISHRAASHGTMVELLENIAVNMKGSKGKGQRKRAPSESQATSSSQVRSPSKAKITKSPSYPHTQSVFSPRPSPDIIVSQNITPISSPTRSQPSASPQRHRRLSLSDDLIKKMLLEKEEPSQGRARTSSSSSGGQSDSESSKSLPTKSNRQPDQTRQNKISSPAILSALQTPIRFPGIVPLEKPSDPFVQPSPPPKSPVTSPRKTDVGLRSPKKSVLASGMVQGYLAQQLARARSGSISNETKLALQSTLIGRKVSKAETASSPKKVYQGLPQNSPRSATSSVKPAEDNTISVPLKKLKGFENVMHILGTNDPNRMIRINLPPGVRLPQTNAPIKFSVISESQARTMGLPVPGGPSTKATIQSPPTDGNPTSYSKDNTTVQSEDEPLDLSMSSESSEKSNPQGNPINTGNEQAKTHPRGDQGHEEGSAKVIPQVDGIMDDRATDEGVGKWEVKNVVSYDRVTDSQVMEPSSGRETHGEEGKIRTKSTQEVVLQEKEREASAALCSSYYNHPVPETIPQPPKVCIAQKQLSLENSSQRNQVPVPDIPVGLCVKLKAKSTIPPCSTLLSSQSSIVTCRASDSTVSNQSDTENVYASTNYLAHAKKIRENATEGLAQILNRSIKRLEGGDGDLNRIPQIDGTGDEKAKKGEEEKQIKDTIPLDGQVADSEVEISSSIALTNMKDREVRPMEVVEDISTVKVMNKAPPTETSAKAQIGNPEGEVAASGKSTKKKQLDRTKESPAENAEAQPSASKARQDNGGKASGSGEKSSKYSKFPKFKGRAPEETPHG